MKLRSKLDVISIYSTAKVIRIFLVNVVRLSCILLLLPTAEAGVVIGGTRFVINENNGTISFSVRNRDAVPYLISTKIVSATAWDGGFGPDVRQIPFIATPPLFMLGANKENIIRIQRAGGDLPQDRESLFQLEVVNIPSGELTGSELQMAFRSRFKLLWRPFGLKGNSGNAYKQLKWNRSGNNTIVNNPTPFIVTLSNLKVNGKIIKNAGVVMPLSSRYVNWCPFEENCQIEWQGIDDYGHKMPLISNLMPKM